MVVGVLRVTLIMHDNHTLKGKRQILKGIIDKVKNRFNVSISEVGDNDLWQRAEIALSAVGGDRAVVNSVMDRAVDFIEGLNASEVLDHEIELINC